MTPRPLVFISAVSRELKSARQLVANTLTFLGYVPIWQDIFETSQGDLLDVLQRQIKRCKGVVQLVGRSYGAEPLQPTAEFGRVSYTQYEALYARKIGKKVWYLFLDETFPADTCVDEPEELRSLQSAYRDRLKADAHLYHPLTSLEGLEASVLKLRSDLVHLRKAVKRWATGVVIVVIAGLVVNFWLLHWQRRTSKQLSETQQTVSKQSQQAAETKQAATEARQAVESMSEEMARFREGIMQYVQIEAKLRESQTESGSIRDQVYEQLSRQMNVNVALLREKLPQTAMKMKDAPAASLLERASAAYVANDYSDAERLAVDAAAETRHRTPFQAADVIRALKLAGFAAQKRIAYATAMAHLQEAAGLTDQQRNPGEWAEIQHAIADVLIDQGQYRQAATVLEGAVETRNSAFGREHPDTLRSRNRLAYALWRQGRYKEAEEQFRQLVAVEERVLGSEDPETLASENGLANALDDEGKHAAAESEHRLVLQARTKVLGPENPETLKSRNNLALALNRQQKYAEAEKQFRELIAVEESVLGPEHPETLRSRRNLFVTLGNQGKHVEAETGFRDLLGAEERVLGPEHPDTLGICNNIGHALAQQQRFAEAESRFRQVIKTETKVLGPEHPATLSSGMALAAVLSQQKKYTEADAECRRVIALEEKVLGPEHPSTISSWHAFAYQLARQNKTEEAMQFARKAATAAEQAFGQDHPDTRKYAQLVKQLESQRPVAGQASVKPLKAGEETSGDLGFNAAKTEYEASSHDETARVRYVTKLADMSAQLSPKILHNPDADAKVAYAKQAGAIEEELRKYPMPRNVDSRKLSQSLVGKWQSPRHTYTFRTDGTYGVADEDRVKWRIDGNKYSDDLSGGPIVLLDLNYFIYAEGQGIAFYTRVKDSEVERNQPGDTNTPTAAEEVNSISNKNSERSSDSAVKDGLKKGANIFTGMVVSDPSLEDRYIAVAAGKDRWRFRTDTGASNTLWLPNVYHPKVGERVSVYYHSCGRLDLCADKIENVERAEEGSMKR